MTLDSEDLASLKFGVGWVGELPADQFSPTERARQRQAEMREARQAEREQERAAEAVEAKAWKAMQEGHVPHTVGEVMAAHAAAADRQDRREAARMHDKDCGCESCGDGRTTPARAPAPTGPKPPSGMTREELTRKHREKAAAEKVTPATVSMVKEHGNRVTSLGAKLFSATGRT